jgi:hypothetical protein
MGGKPATRMRLLQHVFGPLGEKGEGWSLVFAFLFRHHERFLPSPAGLYLRKVLLQGVDGLRQMVLGEGVQILLGSFRWARQLQAVGA